jgi:hypothetical protein
MGRIALRIVYFLTLYLPLEDFLLKWVPVSYPVYLALRQIPDALVLVAAGIAVGARTFTTARFRIVGRAADVCLVLFVASSFTSVFIQNGNLLTAVLNLKALLRYVLIVFVLLNVRVGRAEVYTFFRLVYISLGIQFLVSTIQLVAPYEIDAIFLPRVEDTEVAGTQFQSTAIKEVERGYTSGTMTNTISYGGFLLVGLATYVTRFTENKRLVAYWSMVLVTLFLAFMSGSRGVTIATVLLVMTDHYLKGETQKVLWIGVATLPLLFPILVFAGVDPTDNYFFEIFSGAYVDKAMEQRLGIVLLVLPHFLAGLSAADILFGLSADRAILDQFVSDMFDIPALLVQEIATIEDVYWVALLIYYGVIGFALIAGFFSSVFRHVRTVLRTASGALETRVARIALLLFTVAIPLNFLAQFLETRQFSFYFWLFIGIALSYAAHRSRTLEGDEATE